jgi:hypothetical protein
VALSCVSQIKERTLITAREKKAVQFFFFPLSLFLNYNWGSWFWNFEKIANLLPGNLCNGWSTLSQEKKKHKNMANLQLLPILSKCFTYFLRFRSTFFDSNFFREMLFIIWKRLTKEPSSKTENIANFFKKWPGLLEGVDSLTEVVRLIATWKKLCCPRNANGIPRSLIIGQCP